MGSRRAEPECWRLVGASPAIETRSGKRSELQRAEAGANSTSSRDKRFCMIDGGKRQASGSIHSSSCSGPLKLLVVLLATMLVVSSKTSEQPDRVAISGRLKQTKLAIFASAASVTPTQDEPARVNFLEDIKRDSNLNVKWALWKKLLANTIREPVRMNEDSPSSWSELALDQLAFKFASWPDQSRATLMLLDLQDQNENHNYDSYRLALDPAYSYQDGPRASSRMRPLSGRCIPVTIAQLNTPTRDSDARGLKLVLEFGQRHHQQPQAKMSNTTSSKRRRHPRTSNGKTNNKKKRKGSRMLLVNEDSEEKKSAWKKNNDNDAQLDHFNAQNSLNAKSNSDLVALLLQNNKLTREVSDKLLQLNPPSTPKSSILSNSPALFARLALESANFATRLLSQKPAHRELVNSIVSPSLFRYFMSVRLRAAFESSSSLHKSDEQREENKKSVKSHDENMNRLLEKTPLVALGLVHFEQGEGARQDVGSMQIIGPNKQQHHSKMPTASSSTPNANSNLKSSAHREAPSSTLDIRDLEPSELGQVLAFGNNSSSEPFSLHNLEELAVKAPFLAYWLLAESHTTTPDQNQSLLAKKMKQMGEIANYKQPNGFHQDQDQFASLELKVDDGIWFSPQLECRNQDQQQQQQQQDEEEKQDFAPSSRWLLFYSVPFFGYSQANSNEQLELR